MQEISTNTCHRRLDSEEKEVKRGARSPQKWCDFANLLFVCRFRKSATSPCTPLPGASITGEHCTPCLGLQKQGRQRRTLKPVCTPYQNSPAFSSLCKNNTPGYKWQGSGSQEIESLSHSDDGRCIACYPFTQADPLPTLTVYAIKCWEEAKTGRFCASEYRRYKLTFLLVKPRSLRVHKFLWEERQNTCLLEKI